jgi:membrane-bound serine protease (ClpP class)
MIFSSILAGNVSDAGMILILLTAACVMFVLEVCTPSFGILALLGIMAEGVAVYYGFRIGTGVGFLVLVSAIIGTPVYLYFMVKLLPNTLLGKKLFLKDVPDATNEATPEANELAELVGQTGIAECDLRPSGTVRVNGKRVVAIAEREMIDKGQKIRVIKAGGTDVIVREVKE